MDGVIAHKYSFNWFVNVGNTPSAATGPTGDTTTALGTGKYVYYEATNVPQGTQGSFFSGCLDLNANQSPRIEILLSHVRYRDGRIALGFKLKWFLNSRYYSSHYRRPGTAWIERTVDLTPYKGDVRIIFRAVRGSGFRSDIAVDQVSLRDALPVGIATNENQNEISFFPNPIKDVLRIKKYRSVKNSGIEYVGLHRRRNLH